MKRAPEEGRSRRSEGVEGPGQRQGPGRESRRRQPTAGRGLPRRQSRGRGLCFLWISNRFLLPRHPT